MENIKAQKQGNSDFDEIILKDLISQGYKGQDLIEKFKLMKKAIPQALDTLVEDTENALPLTKEEAAKKFGL